MNTPKQVVDAIFPDALTIGEYTLRPLTLSNMLLLEKLDSPFTRSPEERAKEEAQPPDALDVIRALFILTRTPDQLQSYYEGFNRKQFESDVWAFADTLPANVATTMMPKFVAIFNGATSTLIGAGSGVEEAAPEGEDGKKKKPASKTSTRKASRTDSVGP